MARTTPAQKLRGLATSTRLLIGQPLADEQGEGV
jgi:hypothetical protein